MKQAEIGEPICFFMIGRLLATERHPSEQLTDQLAIGVMGEYSHTWTARNPSGDIDVNSGRGGLYATWFNHGIYLNGAIYGGHNNYESSRSSLEGLATGGKRGRRVEHVCQRRVRFPFCDDPSWGADLCFRCHRRMNYEKTTTANTVKCSCLTAIRDRTQLICSTP
jgi:hypothetical protein